MGLAQSALLSLSTEKINGKAFGVWLKLPYGLFWKIGSFVNIKGKIGLCLKCVLYQNRHYTSIILSNALSNPSVGGFVFWFWALN